MEQRSLKTSAFLAFFLALIALITLVSSTYAWFTFHAYTNVTPISGTISNGEGNLLIANEPTDEFRVTCELVPNDPETELLPVTTADLENFYCVKMQDRDGIATAYAGADERAAQHSLNGTVYLKDEDSGFRVYLWMPSIDCGDDNQSLAAMRLGLKFTTLAGTSTHIFRLDELGNMNRVSERRTIPHANQVVAEVSASGTPEYVRDPARYLSEFTADGTAEDVRPGSNYVCILEKDEIARVDYWLYLEGCDDHCINPVQGSDIALKLGFAGVQTAQ